MAKKPKQQEASSGVPAWMATYGDMMTLLLCFFVLLFSMSSVDVAKFKAAMSSFADQIDILPGGDALTDGELLNNGISQLNDIQIEFSGGMALNEQGDATDHTPQDSDDPDDKDEKEDPAAEDTEVDPYLLAGKIAKEFKEFIDEEGLEAAISISLTSNYVKFTLKGEYLFDSGKANLKPQAVEAISTVVEKLKSQEYAGYDIEIEGHTDNLSISSAQFPNNWILSSWRAYAVLELLIETHGIDPGKVAATGYGEFRPISDNETAEGRELNRRVEVKVILDSEEITLGEVTVDEFEEEQNNNVIEDEDNQEGEQTTPDEETTPDEVESP